MIYIIGICNLLVITIPHSRTLWQIYVSTVINEHTQHESTSLLSTVTGRESEAVSALALSQQTGPEKSQQLMETLLFVIWDSHQQKHSYGDKTQVWKTSPHIRTLMKIRVHPNELPFPLYYLGKGCLGAYNSAPKAKRLLGSQNIFTFP